MRYTAVAERPRCAQALLNDPLLRHFAPAATASRLDNLKPRERHCPYACPNVQHPSIYAIARKAALAGPIREKRQSRRSSSERSPRKTGSIHALRPTVDADLETPLGQVYRKGMNIQHVCLFWKPPGHGLAHSCPTGGGFHSIGSDRRPDSSLAILKLVAVLIWINAL